MHIVREEEKEKTYCFKRHMEEGGQATGGGGGVINCTRKPKKLLFLQIESVYTVYWA